MNDYKNDYFWAGVATISLAVVSPLFWLILLSGIDGNLFEFYAADVKRLSASDAIYLALGLAEIYIYLCLRELLKERFTIAGMDIILLLLVITSIVYFPLLLTIDTGLFIAGDSIQAANELPAINISFFISIASTFVFGVLHIFASILILRHKSDIPTSLKLFSISLLILGVCELGVFIGLNFLAIFIMPIALAFLAAFFLGKPGVLEVI